MFCKHCGNQVEGNSKFCPACGKNLESNIPKSNTKFQLHWILIFVAIGLGLLSLLLGLNMGDNIEAEDVILPAVLALGSVGLSGYVFMDTKNKAEDKRKHTFSLIVLIGAILLAVELCIGPLIGTLIG